MCYLYFFSLKPHHFPTNHPTGDAFHNIIHIYFHIISSLIPFIQKESPLINLLLCLSKANDGQPAVFQDAQVMRRRAPVQVAQQGRQAIISC